MSRAMGLSSCSFCLTVFSETNDLVFACECVLQITAKVPVGIFAAISSMVSPESMS